MCVVCLVFTETLEHVVSAAYSSLPACMLDREFDKLAAKSGKQQFWGGVAGRSCSAWSSCMASMRGGKKYVW